MLFRWVGTNFKGQVAGRGVDRRPPSSQRTSKRPLWFPGLFVWTWGLVQVNHKNNFHGWRSLAMPFYVSIALPAKVGADRFPLNPHPPSDRFAPLQSARASLRSNHGGRPKIRQNDKSRFVIEQPAIGSRRSKVVSRIGRFEGGLHHLTGAIVPAKLHGDKSTLGRKCRCK